MTRREPARTRARRMRMRRMRAAGLVVVIAVIAAALGGQVPASSTPASPTVVLHREHDRLRSEPRELPGDRTEVPTETRGPLGEADRAVPAGTSVFADDVPAVAKLDPALLSAVRRAATDAAGDGVRFVVDSGWRSPAYQEQLLRQAVAKYGSEEEAARWVATPTTSAHVSGNAIDIGPSAAAAWLSAHGAAYGLCQIYRNEAWHYELRPEAVAHGCPPMYADPTQDPRMQQR